MKRNSPKEKDDDASFRSFSCIRFYRHNHVHQSILSFFILNECIRLPPNQLRFLFKSDSDPDSIKGNLPKEQRMFIQSFSGIRFYQQNHVHQSILSFLILNECIRLPKPASLSLPSDSDPDSDLKEICPKKTKVHSIFLLIFSSFSATDSDPDSMKGKLPKKTKKFNLSPVYILTNSTMYINPQLHRSE
jgi:hypothetical protein